jgi:hypothetical protein
VGSRNIMTFIFIQDVWHVMCDVSRDKLLNATFQRFSLLEKYERHVINEGWSYFE